MVTFADKPTMTGRTVELRPVTADDADDMWDDLHDPEATRLTGTHSAFTRDQIDAWCATRGAQTDRLDLAVIDRATGRWAGEVVINDWDESNRSCSLRIALAPGGRDRGLGTEATRLVVGHVFDAIDDPPVSQVIVCLHKWAPQGIRNPPPRNDVALDPRNCLRTQLSLGALAPTSD